MGRQGPYRRWPFKKLGSRGAGSHYQKSLAYGRRLRANAKRRRRNGPQRPLRLSATTFPRSAVVKHKYCCRGFLAPTATAGTKTVLFRANSLFDPEYATGATQHQPLLFDQMAALYDHYSVTSATISITFWSAAVNSTATMDDFAVSLQLKDDPTSPMSAYTVREQPNVATTTLIAPQRKHTLKKHFSAKKFFGKTVVVGESEFVGSVASNPTELAYFILSCTDMGAVHDGESDNSYAINYEVTLIQTATWTERKPIETS